MEITWLLFFVLQNMFFHRKTHWKIQHTKKRKNCKEESKDAEIVAIFGSDFCASKKQQKKYIKISAAGKDSAY